MQQEASAWTIQIKQTAVAAQQRVDAARVSAMQTANAMGAMSQSNRVVDATRDFSGRFGQPESAQCTKQEQAELMVAAGGQRDRDVSHLMQSYASDRVGSQVKAERTRFATRRKAYCSQDEAKAEICVLSPNGMQSWDSNYAGAFTEMTLAPEAELAGYDYAAMVADFRASSPIDCTSRACDAASASQLQTGAMASMAAFALVGQVADRRTPVLTGQ